MSSVDFHLYHTIGNPQGAVARMTGGEFELNGSFFPARHGGPAPGVTAGLDPTQIRFDLPTAQFIGYIPDKPIEIAFSKAMDSTTFSGGIRLEMIESPVGRALSAAEATISSFTYSTSTEKVLIVPASGTLAFNATYRLTISTWVADVTGVPFDSPAVYRFSTLADEVVSNRILASDSKTSTVIPADAAPEDFFTVLRIDPLATPERMDATAYREASRKSEDAYSAYSRPLPDTVREFTAYDRQQNLIEKFSKPVTVEIPYKDANGDGIVDGAVPPIRVDTLSVWWLDESKKLWVRLPNPEIDRTRQVVSAQTTHFSAFALIGAQDFNLSFVRVYPIPFRPNAGDPDRYGRASEGIHIDNLPDTAEITIYTLTGREVKRISHRGIGEERWPGVNQDGQRVASGVYRYVIKSGPNTKVGKMMVIW